MTNADYLLNGQQLKKLYQRYVETAAKKFDLTRLEMDILLFFANNPQYDQAKDFIHLFAAAKSNVSAAVESLLKQGYLSQRRGEEDRRAIHLRLEPLSAPAVEAARQAQQAFYALLFEGFTPGEKENLLRLMGKFSQNIERAAQKENGKGRC